jgi:hypothetical protein
MEAVISDSQATCGDQSSFNGLLAQILADARRVEGDGARSAPFQGVLPLPISALKSASPVLAKPDELQKAVA